MAKTIYDVVLEALPIGRSKAVKRSYLRDQYGLSDRELRRAISYARKKIPVINLSDGKGYYIPDMNTPEGHRDLMAEYRQETARVEEINKNIEIMETTLRACGYDF